MSAVQLSLFGGEQPRVGAGFAQVVRLQLDPECWLDVAPGFLAGHATLFDFLREQVSWQQERRVMYEREVEVPRLIASTSARDPVHAVIHEVCQQLSARYGADFERVGLAYYRDGRDSVAFHRDHLPRDRETLVAVLSLGAPRRFLVRPHGGGMSRAFQPGWGDIIIMGGLSQLRWEHGVPKLKSAAPRMSLMFRHVY